MTVITRQDGDTQYATLATWGKLIPGSTWQTGTLSKLQSYWSRQCTGVLTPNYHQRLRTGELLPMTPWYQLSLNGEIEESNWFVKTHDLTANPVTYGEWWHTGGHRAPAERWVLTPQDLEAFYPESYDQYVQWAAAKIYGNGHDTLTFLAELTSIKGLFRDILKQILRLRYNPKEKIYFLKEMKANSSLWLAARFGIRPLISDIQQLSEAIEMLNLKRTRYSERAGNFYETQNVWTAATAFSTCTVTDVITDKVKVGVRGSVVADIEVPAFQFNPLQTGWELIPFSFVIDWLINVGAAIASWSFLALQTNYVAAKGFSIELERTVTWSITGTVPSLFNSGDISGKAVANASLVVRTPCNIPVLPQLAVRLDSLKVVDLLSLFIQRMKRR